MEVFITNVPEQVTDKGLRNLLKDYMRDLSIDLFHCQKQRQKRNAFLIFLDVNDGNRFLQKYGQTRPSGPINNITAKIRILNTPIFCSISRKPPNQWVLRSLEKEKNDKKTKARTVVTTDPAKTPSKKDFPCSSVSCGIWSYRSSDVVYVPCATFNTIGQAKFGARSLLVKLANGKRIEFFYSSIYNITMEDAPRPSFTIHLWQEPPRFYEEDADESLDSLVSKIARLSIGGQQAQRRRRVPSLSTEHALIAGMCFVYRIILSQSPSGGSQSADQRIEAHMRALQKIPGLPPILHQQIDSYHPTKPTFIADLKRFDSVLTSSSGLPWIVKFQVRKLVYDAFVTPGVALALLQNFEKLQSRSGSDICIAAIRKFRNQIPYAGPDTAAIDLNTDSLVALWREAGTQAQNERRLRLEEDEVLPRGQLATIHRVIITPTGTYLDGPDQEPMNRVLRKYPNHHEYFIRVQFGDEDGEPVRFNPKVSNDAIYHGRFKSVFRDGITIAGRSYAFLGFSHSSLRAQSCWFMAPFIQDGSLLYDRQLIKDLGDFTKIRCPAKCAARIGQAFSETPTAVDFPPETYYRLDDVERNDRVFSDGVGTISSSVMQKIWRAVPSMREHRPTCFQIRFRGAKGMLSLDSRLKGDVVAIRPSMVKFEGSNATDIEICGSNLRPLPMYLNRQVIKILEDMGVDNKWFLDLQSQEIERLRKITSSASNAAKFLKSQSICEAGHLSWFIRKLASLDFEFRSDRFLRDVLEVSVMMQVRVMKYRARIPVPEGLTLFGIMDETGILKEGEIFCTFTKGDKKTVLVGKNLVITRAPALHPGDVQIVNAVNVPEDSPLRWLTNCICFSQKGDRDLPSMLSGGDLDGDLYNIVWDFGCRPTHKCKPADYPRQPPLDIGRTVTRDDMTDFFIQFMETDQLGRIATSHQVLADQREKGTSDEDCKLLAELHSTAVDFSKTGIPIDMKKIPKVPPVRPDFMAPGPNIRIEKKEGLLIQESKDDDDDDDEDVDFTPYRYYTSNKALGVLFRAVDEHDIFSELHKYRMIQHGGPDILDQLWSHIVRETRMIQWHQHVSESEEIRDMYDEAVLDIMKRSGEHPSRPLSELEAFIGNIVGMQGFQSRRQRDLSIPMKEEFDREVREIVRHIRAADHDDEHTERTLARSIACFNVSLGEAKYVLVGGRRSEPLVSFRYIAAAVCLREMEFVL